MYTFPIVVLTVTTYVKQLPFYTKPVTEDMCTYVCTVGTNMNFMTDVTTLHY